MSPITPTNCCFTSVFHVFPSFSSPSFETKNVKKKKKNSLSLEILESVSTPFPCLLSPWSLGFVHLSLLPVKFEPVSYNLHRCYTLGKQCCRNLHSVEQPGLIKSMFMCYWFTGLFSRICHILILPTSTVKQRFNILTNKLVSVLTERL